MSIPAKADYLASTVIELMKTWPGNRTINIVCHGHSVPSGYFATPFVDSLNAYPHQLLVGLKQRFPYAVINVITTGIGGENSETGAVRFAEEVLCHRPDVVTLDYALNDRSIGLERARAAWIKMIEATIATGKKIILLTPTTDWTQRPTYSGGDRAALPEHATQIRALAAEYGVGLADAFLAHQSYTASGDLNDLLSWKNHPNRLGHELVAQELMRWFPVTS